MTAAASPERIRAEFAALLDAFTNLVKSARVAEEHAGAVGGLKGQVRAAMAAAARRRRTACCRLLTPSHTRRRPRCRGR